ncbi:MAG: uroporphyrinogen decarboxylase [Oscillospiraceae bacterium]|nr:uroporphyrinogen decarboxylase [Oscillospiraceae bacterium]
MTRRERVIQAIRHENTDFVPYNIEFTKQAWESMASYTCDENFEESIGNHIAAINYSGYPVEIKPDYFRDDFGVVWNRSGVDKDFGVVEKAVIPEPDLSLYTFPDAPESRIRHDCERLIAEKGDRFTVAGIGFSMFERAWTLTSMEDLLVYMIAEPAFVHELMNAITEYDLKVLKIILEYDVDCVYFGDDWGQQKGLIMGPHLWRAFIKPYMARLYGYAKEHGKYIAQHSCGDIHEIFPDVIEIGLDIYQTFQPEIYDIRDIKQTYGDKLAFWGGISTQRLLPFETPEKVAEVTREIMSVMGENGGYIAAPTHAIPCDVLPENIAALIETFQKQ